MKSILAMASSAGEAAMPEPIMSEKPLASENQLVSENQEPKP